MHFGEGGYTISSLAMNKLQLAPAHYDEMLAHLQACYPEEGCGLVGGCGGRSRQIYPIENRLHSPVAYEMDPLAQITAMLALESEGWELVAIYHSHPNGPLYPSASDVAQAYYPDAMQIIFSLGDAPDGLPAAAGFMIVAGQIERADLLVAAPSD